MLPHPIRLPNGHLSHSMKITRLRVLTDRSAESRLPYMEVWEGDVLVYEGPLDLACLSGGGARPALRVVEGGGRGRGTDHRPALRLVPAAEESPPS